MTLILARIPDCACRILGPKRNLDHRSSSAKLFLFSNEAGVRLFFGIVLCCSHQDCCLLFLCASLTIALTFTSLPFNSHTFVYRCGCGSDLNKTIGESTDLVKKKMHGSAD